MRSTWAFSGGYVLREFAELISGVRVLRDYQRIQVRRGPKYYAGAESSLNQCWTGPLPDSVWEGVAGWRTSDAMPTWCTQEVDSRTLSTCAGMDENSVHP